MRCFINPVTCREIQIKEYISELAFLILRSFEVRDDRIVLDLKIDDRMVLLDTAIPFGLIINELVVNSIKHAFQDRPKGHIFIKIENKGDDRIMLDYRDDGSGVPDDFDFRDLKTLGMKLIFSIGETQLQGKVAFKNEGGLRCLLEIPTDLYEARV